MPFKTSRGGFIILTIFHMLYTWFCCVEKLLELKQDYKNL